jgi:hypothetical protein
MGGEGEGGDPFPGFDAIATVGRFDIEGNGFTKICTVILSGYSVFFKTKYQARNRFKMPTSLNKMISCPLLHTNHDLDTDNDIKHVTCSQSSRTRFGNAGNHIEATTTLSDYTIQNESNLYRGLPPGEPVDTHAVIAAGIARKKQDDSNIDATLTWQKNHARLFMLTNLVRRRYSRLCNYLKAPRNSPRYARPPPGPRHAPVTRAYKDKDRVDLEMRSGIIQNKAPGGGESVDTHAVIAAGIARKKQDDSNIDAKLTWQKNHARLFNSL